MEKSQKIKLFYSAKEIRPFKKRNTTSHYRVSTTLSADLKGYFHYNAHVFYLSPVSEQACESIFSRQHLS